ncbi:radical SAM protein [Patescibacteria group bacterium]|nr:radical SAM protein [Patescibacteria group bacterium]
MKTYPLTGVSPLFEHERQTFQEIGVKINPILEGVTIDDNFLAPLPSGLKPLRSLEFCWLPTQIVEEYNQARDEAQQRELLEKKVYANCPLNCKGCFVKRDSLLLGQKLLHPEVIMRLIKEAVEKLGTKTIKYLGPTEFFRDPQAFEWLDRFQALDLIVGIFIKDPMFGDDAEVAVQFDHLGITSSEELIQKLASYPRLRLLFNFRSFDDQIQNNLVNGGDSRKIDYPKNYKTVQNRALKLLYKHLAKPELEQGRAARLVIINAPVVKSTINEALEIFKYFTDRGVPVLSTCSMASGKGQALYLNSTLSFFNDLAHYYAKATAYSIKRGLVSQAYTDQYGISPYAGIGHCFQLCNGLLIRETGQLIRCPGADHKEWRDKVTPEELVKEGIVTAWQKTRNYKQASCCNVGCLAKPRIFNSMSFKLGLLQEEED